MRDPRVESLLQRGNYTHDYVDKLLFDDIDMIASEANPARVGRKFDHERALQYGLAMQEGAVFPAIVVLRQDGGKYLVATGIHRIRAAELTDWRGAPPGLPAFIVTEPDQYRCDLLIRLLNGIEGRGDSLKDQLKHVIWLHETYGKHSLAELAKQFNINKNTVLGAWSEHQGILRATRLRFDFAEGKQPQNAIVALNQIPSDLVYVKAAEFVVHFDIAGRDVVELVKELKEVRSQGESAELDVIAKWHAEAEEKQRKAKSRIGKTSPTACTRFIGRCRGVNKQVQRGIEHLHLSALSNLDDALAVVEDSIHLLGKVKAELERIQRLASAGGASSGMPMAAAGLYH